MPTIIPFRGWRYRRFPLALVISPPYDVVDQRQTAELRSRHPYNIIHLEGSRAGQGPQAYTAAAHLWQEWRRKKVLEPEAVPALYFYAQSFTWEGKIYTRRGFFCLLRLEPLGRTILPHEETLARARSDRWELLRACRAHFSPIFALYPEEEELTSQLWDRVAPFEPDLDVTDPEGQRHRLWIVTDPQLIGQAQKMVNQQRLILADGHHRFETALRYQELFPSEGSHNWILSHISCARDQGMLVLPTHRLLSALPDKSLPELLEQAQRSFFQVHPVPTTALRSALPPGTLGLYAGQGKSFVLTLHPEVDPAEILPGEQPATWKRLAVTVLHYLLWQQTWSWRWPEEAIGYTHLAEEALALVDRGEYRLAFLLPSPRMEEILSVATAGFRMPQKATYFHPKVPAGLVVFALDNGP
ncbi:DUF1015 domain-containing protein [Desulfothermobacter acidiphilus]|uniref:DUF1015 domain-containing protein n=1 Tax=Desulfothermobacter acidiphilus TaxID=1938353 RepID=UPI003F8A1600